MNKRINYIDIAKGIGIILIVWGHAKGIFANYCIAFCVPFFFILSGFFHNFDNSFKIFLKKKFFRLYLPYIVCNLILPSFILFRNMYLNIDITNNLKYILNIFLTLEKDGFLFGATWFLGSLFVISVTFKFLETIFNRNYAVICLLCLVSVCFVQVINIDGDIRRTIVCSLFYLLGMLVKKYSLSQILLKIQRCTLIILIPLLYCINKYNINISIKEQISFAALLVYILTAVLLTGAIIKISQYIDKTRLSAFFSFIGKNTIHILIWHFVFFEIITAFMLKLNNVPLFLIENYPHVVTNSWLGTLIYFISGLFGSIMLAIFYKRIIFYKNKILN